jgi:hypothetical protein
VQQALQKAEDKAKTEEALATQENVDSSSVSTTSVAQPNQTTDAPVEPLVSTPVPGPVQPDTMMADTVPVQADTEMAYVDADHGREYGPP